MAKPLSKADAFYIESHFGKKTAKEIGKDLGRTEKTVQAYFDKLTADGIAPAAQPEPVNPVKSTGFLVKDGTVIMTPLASMNGDDSTGNSPMSNPEKRAEAQRKNREFELERNKKNHHIINPNMPVR